MKYMEELSKIYDTIMLGVLQFNETEFKKVEDCDPLEIYHRYAKKVKIEIPEALCAFFNCNPEKRSFLSNYFFKLFDQDNINTFDFDCFISAINQEDAFFQHFLLYYFAKENETEEDLVNTYTTFVQAVERINEYKLRPEIKTSLITIYSNFSQCTGMLTEILQTMYKEVQKIHEENTDLIEKLRSDCKKDKVINILSGASNVPPEKYGGRPLLISVFHQFAYMQYAAFDIIGKDYQLVFDQWGNYNHITVESFGNILSNFYMRKIYKILCETKEINATELSKILYITLNSASRYLLNMYWEKAILISRKTNISTYYSLNEDYFRRGLMLLEREVEKIKSFDGNAPGKLKWKKSSVTDQKETKKLFEQFESELTNF